MGTYTYLKRADDADEGEAAAKRAAELINKLANKESTGVAYSYTLHSTNPEIPGWAAPVGAGQEGLQAVNGGALNLEYLRLAALDELPDNASQSFIARLTPGELTELRAFLAEAEELPDGWSQQQPGGGGGTMT